MKALRILIVEDEYLVLMGLRASVEQLGHIVVGEATDGEQAIRLASKTRPDLILMDLNLPRLSGIDAITGIQEELMTPIIVISGYSLKDTITQANQSGVLAYLVKPVGKEELEPAITIAMSRFEEMERLKREAVEAKIELNNRKFIERAKGIIMRQKGMAEDEAMRYLQSKSRNENKKLAEVAKKIVAEYKIKS